MYSSLEQSVPYGILPKTMHFVSFPCINFNVLTTLEHYDRSVTLLFCTIIHTHLLIEPNYIRICNLQAPSFHLIPNSLCLHVVKAPNEAIQIYSKTQNLGFWPLRGPFHTPCCGMFYEAGDGQLYIIDWNHLHLLSTRF